MKRTDRIAAILALVAALGAAIGMAAGSTAGLFLLGPDDDDPTGTNTAAAVRIPLVRLRF